MDDELLRDLERRAVAGDEPAVRELASARDGSGFDFPSEVRRIVEAANESRTRFEVHPPEAGHPGYRTRPGAAGWVHVMRALESALAAPEPVAQAVADPDVYGGSKTVIVLAVKDVDLVTIGAAPARVSVSRGGRHSAGGRVATPGAAWPTELSPWSRGTPYLGSGVVPAEMSPAALSRWAMRFSPDRVQMTKASASRLLAWIPFRQRRSVILDRIRGWVGARDGPGSPDAPSREWAARAVALYAIPAARAARMRGSEIEWLNPASWVDEFWVPTLDSSEVSVILSAMCPLGYYASMPLAEQRAGTYPGLSVDELRAALDEMAAGDPTGFGFRPGR